MVNGYTAICLTKLDILDTLKEIKLAVGYTLRGAKINYFPSSISDLGVVKVLTRNYLYLENNEIEFKVEYVTMPGWQTSTENVREYSDLPENAKKYVEKIEEYLQVPGE